MSAKGKKGKPEVARFDQGKEVRAIARERVGTVKPGRVIRPKVRREKPKHHREIELEETS